jgi:hypothetical protein
MSAPAPAPAATPVVIVSGVADAGAAAPAPGSAGTLSCSGDGYVLSSGGGAQTLSFARVARLQRAPRDKPGAGVKLRVVLVSGGAFVFDLAPAGAHNDEIARELGLDDVAIAGLRARGILA